MSVTISRERYEALARQIQEHDRRYYVENDPTIADAEYDKLYKELQAIEAAQPDWIVDWSPTRRVGGPVLRGPTTRRVGGPALRRPSSPRLGGPPTGPPSGGPVR